MVVKYHEECTDEYIILLIFLFYGLLASIKKKTSHDALLVSKMAVCQIKPVGANILAR